MWDRCVSACGKLPSRSPLAGVGLLGQQPEVVGARHRPVEHLACVGQLARARQALDEPERAAHERALLTVEAVVAPVAVQQPLAGVELLTHAAIVRTMRSSSQSTNPARGNSSSAASSSGRSNACTNTPRLASKPRRSIARRISSRAFVHRRVGARRMHSSASVMPRSSAAQHITFECTKCSGSPGHSQIP